MAATKLAAVRQGAGTTPSAFHSGWTVPSPAATTLLPSDVRGCDASMERHPGPLHRPAAEPGAKRQLDGAHGGGWQRRRARDACRDHRRPAAREAEPLGLTDQLEQVVR